MGKLLSTIKNTKSKRFKPDAFLTHEPTTKIVEDISIANKGPREKSIIIFVLINKAKAMDILTLNTKNRPITTELVLDYTRIMKAGQWLWAAKTLLISKGKVLIDGQHELWAVIESDTTQMFHIQTQLDDSVFAVVDQGKRRTAGDTLAYQGYENFNILGRAIKAETYYRLHGKVGAKIDRHRMTNMDVYMWTKEQNIDLMQKCLRTAMAELHTPFQYLTMSSWAMIYYTISKRHETKADKFVRLLSVGGNELTERKNSPILACRERLKKGFQDNDPNHRLEKKLKCVIGAWNLYRLGKAVTIGGIQIKDGRIPKAI